MFLADLDGGPVVRAVKAFYVNPSGIHGGKIVTVGPFRDEGEPGAHEPHVVRRLAVVDLTSVLVFAFSTAPEHVSFGPPRLRGRRAAAAPVRRIGRPSRKTLPEELPSPCPAKDNPSVVSVT